MAGPGDPIGAEDALADGAELLHCCLAAAVASVDAELDPAEAALEGADQHHVLDAAVKAAPAQVRAVVRAANLQHLAVWVDANEARHADDFVAVEEDESPVCGVGDVAVHALVKTVRAEIVGVDLPDLGLHGAGG